MIEAVYHPEGRVYNTNVMTINPSVVWRYEYSIRDHASASLSTGLGNTRITLRLCSAQAFSDLNGTCPERSRRDNKVDVSSSATTNEVLQENQYYPGVYPERSRRGLGTNGAWMNNAALDNLYQYTCPERSRRDGKELNADWGLNLYDYGFRWSDQALGRFVSVDPLAESYSVYTTYQYAGNNPLGNIDLDGLEPGGQVSPEMQSVLNQAAKSGATPIASGTAGTLTERKTTRMERWRDNVESGKAGFISRMAYHMVNDVWVGAQDMTPGVDRPRNLGGDEVSGSERQNGAVGLVSAALPGLGIADDAGKSAVIQLDEIVVLGKQPGKLGGMAHRQKVANVAADILERGNTYVAEYQVKTPGGIKGSRFADIAEFGPNGELVKLHQVGKKTKSGNPVSRERKAMEDISKARPDTPVDFHPYN